MSRNAIVIDENGNKVDLVLTDAIADLETGIVKDTPQGFTMLPGYTLIFDDPGVALGMIKPHWTGSAWEETGSIIVTPEMLETARTGKLDEINAACSATVDAGVDVPTSQGVKHFSLTAEDQINISALADQLKSARKGEPSTIDIIKGVPYHADGELCCFWSPDDFDLISNFAVGFKFYQTTYCNHLRDYIKRIMDYDELKTVQYGMPLPADLQTNLISLLPDAAKAILAALVGGVDA